MPDLLKQVSYFIDLMFMDGKINYRLDFPLNNIKQKKRKIIILQLLG